MQRLERCRGILINANCLVGLAFAAFCYFTGGIPSHVDGAIGFVSHGGKLHEVSMTIYLAHQCSFFLFCFLSVLTISIEFALRVKADAKAELKMNPYDSQNTTPSDSSSRTFPFFGGTLIGIAFGLWLYPVIARTSFLDRFGMVGILVLGFCLLLFGALVGISRRVKK